MAGVAGKTTRKQADCNRHQDQNSAAAYFTKVALR